MIAHYHGQTWNAAEFARSLGSSEATARRYLDILAGAFMVRVLPPRHHAVDAGGAQGPGAGPSLDRVSGDEGYVLDDRISLLPVAEIGTLVERIGSKGW